MNKKWILLILLIIGIISVPGCLGVDEGVAEFDVDNLEISHEEAEVGETVEVSVDVENVGDKEGEYTVEVEVNDETFSEDVVLDAGESETVTFEVTKEEGGTYNVEVADLSDTFEVEEEEEFEELELIEFKFIDDIETLEEVEPEYGPDEVILSYFTVNGFEISDENIVDWEYYVTIYDPDGEPLEGFEDEKVFDGEGEADPDWEWASVNFIPELNKEEKWDAGEHEVEFTVVDEIGDKEFVFTETFEVVDTTEPAEFEVSNLDVSPDITGVGETVEVSVDVENVGDKEGEYTVGIEVNDELFSEDVTLEGKESETVTFEVTKEETGIYNVEVEDLSDTFEVVDSFEELRLAEFKFVEDFEDEEEIEPEYAPEDNIFVYFDVLGFEADDDGTVEWKSYITVYGPDGEPVEGLDNLLIDDGEDQESGLEWGFVDFTAHIWPGEDGWDEGEHEVVFTVVDEVGDKDMEITRTFDVS